MNNFILSEASMSMRVFFFCQICLPSVTLVLVFALYIHILGRGEEIKDK